MKALEPFRTSVHVSSRPAAAPADASPEPQIPPLRVLLAEDNPINQKLLLRILEKQGHDVTVAENGETAVTAYEQGSFDLILMDVHMPRMNGFEATARIRALEQNAAVHVPIIALTARTMKGDRDQCLDAGMDDYISKPMSKSKVQEVLLRHAPRPRNDATERDDASPSTEDRPAAIDWEVLLDRFGDDWAFIAEVTSLFMEERTDLMPRIQEAIETGDADALEHAAHTLKGAAANLHAEPTRRAARRLEKMGASGNLAGARDACAALDRELDRFAEAVETLQEEHASHPPVGV